MLAANEVILIVISEPLNRPNRIRIVLLLRVARHECVDEVN